MLSVLLVVISFGAYAAGAVLTRRAVKLHAGAAVHPLEALFVAAALGGIVHFRPAHFALKYFALCASAMWIAGAAGALLTGVTKKRVSGGTREFEDACALAHPASLWKRWLGFSRAVADYEIRLVLVASYLLIIGPIAIAFRLFQGNHAGNNPASTWVHRSDSPGLDAARRPF